jgi:inhibitor of cysteine peptidase
MMGNRLRISLILMMTSLVLGACSPRSTLSGVQVSEQDAGKTIQLKVGQTITVSLTGNMTTGYTWEGQNLDVALLDQIGEMEYHAEQTGAVGSGGTYSYNFRAVKAGSTTLHMIYHRTFEKNTPPLRTFEVNIEITAP